MRGHKLRAWIILLCALILLGCEKGITITIVDPDASTPTFNFKSSSAFSSDGDEITVFWVAESKSNSPQTSYIIWRIESADGTPKHVNQIKFGVIPDGFREVGITKPLIAGTKYEAGAGMAGKIGLLLFEPTSGLKVN
jgi:hypothetical protein